MAKGYGVDAAAGCRDERPSCIDLSTYSHYPTRYSDYPLRTSPEGCRETALNPFFFSLRAELSNSIITHTPNIEWGESWMRAIDPRHYCSLYWTSSRLVIHTSVPHDLQSSSIFPIVIARDSQHLVLSALAARRCYSVCIRTVLLATVFCAWSSRPLPRTTLYSVGIRPSILPRALRRSAALSS